MTDVIAAWRGSLTCEIGWASTPESPGVLAAVPLLWEGLPCVALPYALARHAAPLRAAAVAGFALTDPNTSTARGLTAIGPVEVVDDVYGERFQHELLTQELVKHPPSRVYADSPLLRREHWWWLPRIIVRLSRVERVVDLPTRADPARDALLVRDDGAGLRLDVVAPAGDDDWPAAKVRLRSPGGALRGDGARAVAFGHTYTLPDVERWETWRVRGVIRGDEMVVADREGVPEPSLEPLGLVQRIRRQRALERGCRRGIADAERRSR